MEWIDVQTHRKFRIQSYQVIVFASSPAVFEWGKKRASNSKDCFFDLTALRGAMSRGDLVTVKYIWNQMAFVDRCVMMFDSFIWSRDLTMEVIKFLSGEGVKVDNSRNEIGSISACNLDIVKWALEENEIGDISGDQVMRCFARSQNPDLEVLSYLMKRLSTIPDCSVSVAVMYSRTDMLKLLLSKGVPFQLPQTMDLTIVFPSIEMLHLLYDLTDDKKQFFRWIQMLHHPAPPSTWRELFAMGLPPQSVLKEVLECTSIETLDLVKWMVEEKGCTLPSEKDVRVDSIRKDVMRYVIAYGGL